MGMGTSRTRRGGGASLADGAETPPITPETARRQQGGTGTNRGQRSATSSSPPLNKRSGAAPSPSTHSSSASSSSYAGGGRHGKTRIGRSQPTDIAAGGNSIIMPFSPSSGINMAVSPSKRVPTGTERIPTVITWASGGKQVAVTGTWNNWKEAIPLNKSEHDFATILELPPGVHQYKFLVDGKWKHAPDQPVAVDTRGNLTNCMEVKEFRLEPIFLGKGSPPGSYSTAIPPEILTPRPAKEGEGEDDEDEEETKKKKEREENGRSNNLRTVEEDEEFQLLGMALSAWSDIEMGENFPYSTDKEDEDEEDGERNRNRKEKDSENETSEEEEGEEEDNEREGRRKKGANTKNTPPTYPILKEPPTLPPHLLKAVLNHQMEEDPTVLPLPHHVMLNHLYFKEYDSEDEDMDDACVVGTTYRYRQKFVTTVFYRPATLRPRAAKNSPPTPAAPKEGEATATNATQPSEFQAV